MGRPVQVQGPWKTEFIEGGPTLPKPLTMKRLTCWTAVEDPAVSTELQVFFETARYTVSFDNPALPADDWILDLGRVCHYVRVKLNGQTLDTLFAYPYELRLSEALIEGVNTLENKVTNLPANRIIEMERRKVPWCNSTFGYGNRAQSTPADWPLFPSGLLARVRLQPIRVQSMAKDAPLP